MPELRVVVDEPAGQRRVDLLSPVSGLSTLLFTVLAGCAAVLRAEGSYEALMAPVAGVERNLKDIPVSAQSLRLSRSCRTYSITEKPV